MKYQYTMHLTRMFIIIQILIQTPVCCYDTALILYSHLGYKNICSVVYYRKGKTKKWLVLFSPLFKENLNQLITPPPPVFC